MVLEVVMNLGYFMIVETPSNSKVHTWKSLSKLFNQDSKSNIRAYTLLSLCKSNSSIRSVMHRLINNFDKKPYNRLHTNGFGAP